MPKRIPEQECIDRLNALDGRKFVRWVGEYKNSRSRAVMVCSVDGYEWTATPFNLIHSGSGCPKCSGNRRYSQCERVDQINSIENVEFIGWVNGYKTHSSKAIVKCSIDGHVWSASVGSLVNGGKGCPKCGNVYRYSECERINQINSIDGVSFVRWDSSYKNKTSKAVVSCCCNHEWIATVRDLVSYGRGCPFCAKSGFSPSKAGTLYLLRSECGQYVKVGISNKHTQRIRDLSRGTPFIFEVIELYHNEDGKEIARLEKEFHSKYESAGFKGFDGATEWLKFSPELLEEFRSLSR